MRVFDAEERASFPDAEGKLMHAEVRIADTVVMLADGNADWPPLSSYVHIYVPDVDDTYRRALEAGASSIQEPVKKDGGQARRSPGLRRHDLVDRHEVE